MEKKSEIKVEVKVEYPKYLYHAKKGAVLLQSREEEEALGKEHKEYFDHPDKAAEAAPEKASKPSKEKSE